MLSYTFTLESISFYEPEAIFSMSKIIKKICYMNRTNFRHHAVKERKRIHEVVLIHTYNNIWLTHYYFFIVLEEINLVESVDAKANHHCCFLPQYFLLNFQTFIEIAAIIFHVWG